MNVLSFPFGLPLSSDTIALLAWQQRKAHYDHVLRLVDAFTAAMAPIVEDALCHNNCRNNT